MCIGVWEMQAEQSQPSGSKVETLSVEPLGHCLQLLKLKSQG